MHSRTIRIIAGIYLTASAVVLRTGTSPTSETTNRQIPKGGVMMPIINAMTMITPK